MVEKIVGWLDRIDPGVHRRVKGLRLVTAYGIAAMLGALLYSSDHISGGSFLSYLAAGFGLWASVSEGQATRWLSTRDLVILNAAAVTGALSLIGLAPILMRHGQLGPEWILITGAFLVGISSDSESLVRASGTRSISASFLATEPGSLGPIWDW